MKGGIQMSDYSCPDCDKVQMKFLKVSAEGVHFFCYYCRKNVLVQNIRPEYLPNRIVILRNEFPGI